MIPKFRAWDKFDKVMRDVTLLDYNQNFVGYSYPVFMKSTMHMELMRSTGLQDKNCQEVFEGDIVKMSKDVYSEPTYYEVVRHRGGAYRLESKQHGCELWLRHTDCEVVGNVYENPELLEDKECTQK